MDKVVVDERALLARLNRQLGKEAKRLRRCKPDAKARADLGAVYLVNVATGAVVAKHVDIEALARESGVMKAWEVLEVNNG